MKVFYWLKIELASQKSVEMHNSCCDDCDLFLQEKTLNLLIHV